MALLPPAELAGLWAPEGPYLNTASYGLPPRPAFDALAAALDEWRAGRTGWESWTQAVDEARATWSRLVGFDPDDVAVGATVSELVGVVAASLPDGARVLAPDVEFTSALFPFLAQAGRGVDVRTVPREALADAVDPDTALVAVSAVHSADGVVADLDAISAAARDNDALLLVDATQAVGWLPLAGVDADFVVGHGYKWLLSPRGTAYLAVRPERLAGLVPVHAGWWAGEERFGTYYGPPLRLARSARRLDTSPAWFSWVGAAPALAVLEGIGIDRIRAHDVELANRFRAGVGLQATDSAIVAVDVPGAEERLARAGIRAAVRAGKVRVSFHLYNTPADVDAALHALAV